MKQNHYMHDEIGALLRASRPACDPPPELADRIVGALMDRGEFSRTPRWQWLLLPPAVAAAIALSAFLTKSNDPIASTPAPPPGPTAFAAIDDINPLQTEATAIQTDALRAGKFLVDCLPTFNLAENE